MSVEFEKDGDNLKKIVRKEQVYSIKKLEESLKEIDEEISYWKKQPDKIEVFNVEKDQALQSAELRKYEIEELLKK